jgi:hypothetical protein
MEFMDDDALMKNYDTFLCLYDEIHAYLLINYAIDARTLFTNKPVPKSTNEILRNMV